MSLQFHNYKLSLLKAIVEEGEAIANDQYREKHYPGKTLIQARQIVNAEVDCLLAAPKAKTLDILVNAHMRSW